MKTKGYVVMGLVMLAAFGANHAEHYFRAQGIRRQAAAMDVPVVQMDTSAAGHNSIAIDEQSLGKNDSLHFSTLALWAFDAANSAPPPAVMAANGQAVKMLGFMYPLQNAAELKEFCLLRSTQTCCYGPRPQFNQYVFVEMPQPVKFERLAPVVVEGNFWVDPQPQDGYIYRMEGRSVRPAMGDDQPPDPAEVARQAKAPLFDFAPLEAAKTAADKDAAIARLAAELDGKQMVLQGFIVDRAVGSPVKLTIGKYAWDGKAKGTPFNLYNSVLVTPKSPQDVPPVWWQEAVFTGTARVTQDPSRRGKDGVVGLVDATLAVGQGGGPLVDAGPLLPVLMEVLILAVFALTFFTKLRSGRPVTKSKKGDGT